MRGLFVALLGAALVSGALVGPGAAPPAGAQANRAGCLTVHVGPQLRPGETSSYFQLTIAPGRYASEALVLANPNNYACQVGLSASYGQTAVNSGDTYPALAPGVCKRTSCWLSGLPGVVTIPARARTLVGFKVRVPAGARPGQYLAGVLARPHVRAAEAPHIAGTRVGALVNTSVGIGVAVVVPGPLSPLISIPSVMFDTANGIPLLHITERNAGNTWEHPAGGAMITAGPAHVLRFGVSSSTVLPGGSATLTLPVLGTPYGRHVTTVILWYAHDTKKALWTGVINYPESRAAVPSPHGTQVVVTTVEAPRWVIALAITLGAVVVVLVLVLLLLVFRRRRDRHADEVPDERASRG
ncbi:MAG TPA: hypothetical protein VME46_15640, partial [Acidimicrobiales bacterium]|nr:hypothetical protein [Acidimicrobiales bacterium]